MENSTMSEANTPQKGTEKVITGGWSPFTSHISDMAQEAFNKAMSGLMGVRYEPVAVSEQVVAGMNYQFFCNSQVVYPDAPVRPVMVHITALLNQDPHITAIKPVE
jgi:hypothetical protein